MLFSPLTRRIFSSTAGSTHINDSRGVTTKRQDTIKGGLGGHMKATPEAPFDSGELLPVRVWPLSWLTVLVATALLSGAWWWLGAGGYGVGHPRFWANSVAPIVGLTVSLTGLVALRLGHGPALRWLLPVWPAAWFGMALAGRLLFPITLGQLWLIPLSGSVVMGLAVLPLWRDAGTRAQIGVVSLGLCVTLSGAALVRTQYPPAPRTRPSFANAIAAIPPAKANPAPETGVIRLGGDTMVHASDGSLTVRKAPLSISVHPLLTFLNGSKDGCWSVLARPGDRVGPEPRLRWSQIEAERSCTLDYEFRGQGPASLRIQVEPPTASVVMKASTSLMRTVYSHLNAYCDIEVRGHRRLELEFSPCTGVPIEVKKFDYPSGRPARFAYVEEDRTFRVVEAASGEKGPFHTLARGHLGSEQTLTIGLRDQGQTLARISLLDWSAQADTTLSPTAGWGAPVNAIEFNLVDNPPSSPASIFVTLAGTSVGRGWDCVGHNPGTYRNRVRVEAVKISAGQPERE